MRQLNHPNIVRMKDAFETDQYFYIVMEKVNGGELLEHLVNGTLSEQEAASIMYKILSAIQYMQDFGVIHRDLKPENILVEKNSLTGNIENIKIIDFGLSKVVLPDELILDRCGTLAYVAPEVLLKRGYGMQVDVWSAGCILY